jgi:hypothetical protein
MPRYKIYESFSNSGTRNEVRMRVVNKFSEEIHGEGKGELASRYSYYVEELNDGKNIYLKRPAFMHNGFDFAVCVEEVNFNLDGKRSSNRPTHEVILNDLAAKLAESRGEYNRLYQVIKRIYLCKDIDYENIRPFAFYYGYPYDLILKTLKWLFIEQDIRYWNYSGRDMLWSKIQSI